MANDIPEASNGHEQVDGANNVEPEIVLSSSLGPNNTNGSNTPEMIPPPGVEIVSVTSRDAGEKVGPTVAAFKDHFTLSVPTSTIRYRDSRTAARVLEGLDYQFVLEEAYNPKTKDLEVTIRRIYDSNFGTTFLRATYTLFTAFWIGFLFVMCIQILLFLCLDLAIDLGITSKQDPDTGAALGIILSFPMFIYALSSSLVLAGAYLQDTWHGHPLIRNFTFRSLPPSVSEWIFFIFFLALPLVAMALSLFSRSPDWWEYTCLTWFTSVAAFYLIFVVNVIVYEMRACWEVVRNRYKTDDDTFLEVLKRCILLRQVATYAGRKHEIAIARGTIRDSEYTDDVSKRNIIDGSNSRDISIFARLTILLARNTSLYEELDEPEQIYTIDDARDVRPFVTSHTWGLEKFFCRPRRARYVAIVSGPGAVTADQMRSTVACSFFGSFLILLVLISGLYYAELDTGFYFLMLIACALVAGPTFAGTYQLYKGAQDVAEATASQAFTMAAAVDDRDVSEALYLTSNLFRLTKPAESFCWIMFGVEWFFLFIWPLAGLLVVNNFPLALLFMSMGFITFMRHYINAAIVLEETGNMDLVDGETEEELWNSQSRLNRIVGDVTRGRSRHVWLSILGFLGFAFLALMVGAIGSNTEEQATFDTPYKFLDNFKYDQSDSLRYATCQLTSEVGGPVNSMADYAFLAGLAYRGRGNVTQRELDGWFGAGIAVNRDEVVDQWRADNDVNSAVSFKLVTFPAFGNYAYVLIRGTTNNWDMLTDAQLWSAAMFMQGLREVLPFGAAFSPIMHLLIQAMSNLESKSIDRVSFYKTTAQFVRYLQSREDEYSGVGVTGHSLGGGLSIITGAQTGAAAVALSGPNAMLSRRTFSPPLSRDDLDSKTFNIIPSRDLVPKFDDPAQNYQIIRCQAPFEDVLGCHDSTRSLCEIISTCGTGRRPALCECADVFNFRRPVPLRRPFQDDVPSYEEACAALEESAE